MIKAFLQRRELNILYTVILIIQTFIFLDLLNGPYNDGTIRAGNGLYGLFVYLFTFLQFSAIKKYLIINIFWTMGFLLVFQDSIASLSGVLLIIASVWLYQREKLNP